MPPIEDRCQKHRDVTLSGRCRRLRDSPSPLELFSMVPVTTTVLLCALLGGCAAVPSINVLGAYFPDWMFCIIGAIVTTGLLQALLRAKGFVGRPGGLVAPVAYSALTAMLALTGWLVFFNN